MRRRRFSDVPLLFKLGFPPAFAVLMLASVAAATLWSQQRQASVLADLIDLNNMQDQIAMDAQRITLANDALYQALAAQAVEDYETRQVQAAGTRDRQEGLAEALLEIDTASKSLRMLQPSMSAAQRQNINGVLNGLIDYRNAVRLVGARLELNFPAAAAFIRPYKDNYARLTQRLNDTSRQMSLEQMQMARVSTHRARLVALLTLASSATRCFSWQRWQG